MVDDETRLPSTTDLNEAILHARLGDMFFMDRILEEATGEKVERKEKIPRLPGKTFKEAQDKEKLRQERSIPQEETPGVEMVHPPKKMSLWTRFKRWMGFKYG